MPQRVIKQPNGKLAVFSTIVDGFTIIDANYQEMIDYWIGELGEAEGTAKVQRGIDDDTTGICKTTKRDGLNRWRDAIATIRFQHGDIEAERVIAELSEVKPGKSCRES